MLQKYVKYRSRAETLGIIPITKIYYPHETSALFKYNITVSSYIYYEANSVCVCVCICRRSGRTRAINYTSLYIIIIIIYEPGRNAFIVGLTSYAPLIHHIGIRCSCTSGRDFSGFGYFSAVTSLSIL